MAIPCPKRQWTVVIVMSGVTDDFITESPVAFYNVCGKYSEYVNCCHVLTIKLDPLSVHIQGVCAYSKYNMCGKRGV